MSATVLWLCLTDNINHILKSLYFIYQLIEKKFDISTVC